MKYRGKHRIESYYLKEKNPFGSAFPMVYKNLKFGKYMKYLLYLLLSVKKISRANIVSKVMCYMFMCCAFMDCIYSTFYYFLIK